MEIRLQRLNRYCDKIRAYVIFGNIAGTGESKQSGQNRGLSEGVFRFALLLLRTEP